MKTLTISLLILLSIVIPVSSQTHLKLNLPTSLLLAPQVGLETKISDNLTYQVDMMGSFWESFNGISFKIGMLSNDLRYYPDDNLKGFYFGPSLGFAGYPKIQKKRYWHRPIYQEGWAILMGGTLGYVWELNEKWSLDLFAGGGFIQSFNIHRSTLTHERLDKPSKPGGVWDKSGEWVAPYRGGLMLSLKL